MIARDANRFLGNADREVLRLANLRHRVTSVFLVLSSNRLDAYSRWLRLLVSEALQDIARDAERPQEPPGGLSRALAHLAAPERPQRLPVPLCGPLSG